MNNEIKALLETYQKGLCDPNIDLICQVYTDDAMFIGQPFPTADGLDQIITLYKDFQSKLKFDVEFEVKELILDKEYGYMRTESYGSIVPVGQPKKDGEGNREIFILKKEMEKWKIHRYIFNEVIK
jgi:ketosteroid isomerase-like protein